jgi:hypothetical protein
MAATAAMGVTDAQGVVLADLPCRKCGYNLRGLSLDGRCPECGSAVGLSVQGDLMRYSQPRWVRTLQRGVVFILSGIGVFVIGFMFTMVIGATRGPIVVGQGVLLVANLLMVVGAWLLTEPDPGGIGEDRYGTSRKIIRVALVIGVTNTFLNLVSGLSAVPPPVRIVLQIVQLLAALIGLVGQIAQLNYISKLAARIPDVGIEQRARFLMFAIGITYGIFLLVGLGAIVATMFARPVAAGGGGVVGAIGCVAALAGLALLVFGIMYLLMLDKLRVRLGQEASAAESSWARLEMAGAAPVA